MMHCEICNDMDCFYKDHHSILYFVGGTTNMPFPFRKEDYDNNSAMYFGVYTEVNPVPTSFRVNNDV